MKYHHFIIILILTFFPLYAQTNSSTSEQTQDKHIEEITNNADKINSTTNNEELEQRLETAAEIIRFQDAQINAIQLILIGISVFIAIFIPLFTYIFAIKPAREATKELESKFPEFLKGHEKKQIEQAIENLKSSDKQLKQSASLYLSLNQYFPFEDSQLFKIQKSLSDPQIEESTKRTLALLIIK